MKKLIAATAIAAGALGTAGTASAQDLGNIIANVLGFGTPQYSYNQGIPAVVAPQQQMYRDSYGRTFYYDQYGRQVYLNNTQQIVGYDQWGRPIYGSAPQYPYGGNYAYGSNYGSTYGNSWDRDGDGIANSRDRWPDDSRYY
jgi:hypothetical protein